MVTNDVRAFEIVENIIHCVNSRDFDVIEELLTELKQYISMEEPINIQYVKRIEVKVRLGQGKITNEEAVNQFEEIMGYTLPYEMALKNRDKYLTNAEMQCLLYIAVYSERAKGDIALNALMEFCMGLETNEGVYEHISIYEMCMINIANIYGNLGKYDRSDEISLKTIKESVHCYRMSVLDDCLYINIWNETERKKKNISAKQRYIEKQYLINCITLCQINNKPEKENALRKRFGQIIVK